MRLALALVLALAGQAAAEDRAFVAHVPPAEGRVGEPLKLAAVVERSWLETALIARYRTARSDEPWHEVSFERSSAGGWRAAIPADDVVAPGIEYFVVGIGPDGKPIAHFASAERPHMVRVDPERGGRWIGVERRRLQDRVDRVESSVEYVDLGRTYGADRFVRWETTWTHRLVTRVYSLSLGYGMLDGVTPDRRSEDPMEIQHVETGYRYGHGGARVRVTRNLWVDAAAVIGFSHEGFEAGGRFAFTLGRDWRSCVSAGAELLDGMGDSYWLKLQWDTVPPFLMSARLRATDLPAAVLQGGSTIEYFAEYPVRAWLRVGAKLTYGVRDRRPGWFGGGLSAAMDF